MQEDDWNFYRCNVNDRLSSVFTDMSLVKVAPINSLPMLNWLWIKLKYPDDRGLSTDQEFDSLRAYEDELEFALSESRDIKYVGRITGAGRREFYFYSSENADFRGQIYGVLSNHPDYQFQIGSKVDELWDQYHSLLYPGEHGLEQIRSRSDD